MTISPADTYDVVMEMRDTTGTVFTADTDCSAYANPELVGEFRGAQVSARAIGSVDDDDGVGCEVRVAGVLIAYMARGLGENEVTKVSYSKFAAYLKEEKISEINITPFFRFTLLHYYAKALSCSSDIIGAEAGEACSRVVPRRREIQRMRW